MQNDQIFTARKRSFAKVMFLHVSVILSTVAGGRGVPGQVPPWDQVHPPGTKYTPRDQVHPPEQCMLGDTGNKRAVRILLQCILVQECISVIPYI